MRTKAKVQLQWLVGM